MNNGSLNKASQSRRPAAAMAARDSVKVVG